jgi:hypothetical protein
VYLAYQREQLVFPNPDPTNENEYELFKNTQMQYFNSHFVLSAALNKPEGNPISRLPILQKQDDPVAWLKRHLSVSSPDHSQVIEISLSADEPDEAADIVTAVVDAYKSEVIDVEMDKRKQRVDELDRLYTEKDLDVREKRRQLKQLAEQLGTAETENLNLNQKLTLEELATYRQELARSEFEVGRLRSDLASRQAELAAVKSTDVSDLECELFAQSDPVLKNLSQEILLRKMDKEPGSHAQTPEDKSSKDAEKRQAELERLTKDYAERITQIREEIRHKRQTDVEKEIKRVEAAIEITNKQQRNNEEDVQRLKKLAQQFGSSSVDVEMLRADILVRVKSLDTIASERDKLKVELRSPLRINISQKKASVEKRPPLIFLP